MDPKSEFAVEIAQQCPRCKTVYIVSARCFMCGVEVVPVDPNVTLARALAAIDPGTRELLKESYRIQLEALRARENEARARDNVVNLCEYRERSKRLSPPPL